MVVREAEGREGGRQGEMGRRARVERTDRSPVVVVPFRHRKQWGERVEEEEGSATMERDAWAGLLRWMLFGGELQSTEQLMNLAFVLF